MLLATTKTGKLQEVVVPRSTPTRLVVKTLRSSTWGSFDSLSTGACTSATKARVILATLPSGKSYVYYDASSRDYSARDFSRGYPVTLKIGAHFGNSTE